MCEISSMAKQVMLRPGSIKGHPLASVHQQVFCVEHRICVNLILFQYRVILLLPNIETESSYYGEKTSIYVMCSSFPSLYYGWGYIFVCLFESREASISSRALPFLLTLHPRDQALSDWGWKPTLWLLPPRERARCLSCLALRRWMC